MAFSRCNCPRPSTKKKKKKERGSVLLIASEHTGKTHDYCEAQQQLSYTSFKEKVLPYLYRGRGDVYASTRLFVVGAITDATRKGQFA